MRFTALTLPWQVYGMLIYKLLGDKVQQEFARSWGVSYGACVRRAPPQFVLTRRLAGMNVATEWKDVLIESLKGAVILAIRERFYVTRAGSWFEDHVGASAVRAWVCTTDAPAFLPDYYCIQSQLFNHATMNIWQQSRLLWKHSKRISD